MDENEELNPRYVENQRYNDAFSINIPDSRASSRSSQRSWRRENIHASHFASQRDDRFFERIRRKMKGDNLLSPRNSSLIQSSSDDETSALQKRPLLVQVEDPPKKSWIDPLLAFLSLVFFFAGVAGIIVFVLYRDVYWMSERLYQWLLWISYIILSFLLIRLVISIIFKILKVILVKAKRSSALQLYFYIQKVRFSLALIFWSPLHRATWGLFLYREGIKHDNNIDWYLNRFFLSTLLIGIFHSAKLVFDKVIIAHFQKQQFWETIRDAVFKETVLQTIIFKQAGKKSDLEGFAGTDAPSNREFRRAWVHILKKKFLLDNPYEAQRTGNRQGPSAQIISELVDSIFENMDQDDKGHLTIEDFEEVFILDEYARKAFEMFDLKSCGKAERDDIISVVTNIYRERAALFDTLQDRENISGIITRTTGIAFWLFMFVILLLIFDVALEGFLIPASTSFLGFAFIFGNNFKNIWESLVFTFMVRAYDIGDRITMDGFPTLIISRIYVLSTEAYTPDGRHVIIPSQILANNAIYQYKRSKNYSDLISFQVHASTTKKQLRKMEAKVRQYVAKKHPWKEESFFMWVSKIDKMNQMTIEFWVELADVNWQKPMEYLIPKGDLLLEMKSVCRELGIKYYPPSQKVKLWKYPHEQEDMKLKEQIHDKLEEMRRRERSGRDEFLNSEGETSTRPYVDSRNGP